MPTKFYTYESKAERRRRLAQEWMAKAREAVFQAQARRRLQQANIDPDTMSSLPVPITTDVSDVGEEIPPTRKEKKKGGGLFSRIKDVAGDVTETVFRGPVKEPWDVLKPAIKAAEWEEEKIGRPLWRGASATIVAPVIAATQDTSLTEAWKKAYKRMEEAPGWIETPMGIVFSPTTWVPVGLAAKALKAGKLSPLATKVPALSALFRSRPSRAAFANVAMAGKIDESAPALSVLERVNQIEQVRFLEDDPARIIQVMKGQTSAISRARNTLGRVLPDSMVESLNRRGFRLVDTDAVYHVMDWKEGVGEFATSLPVAYRHHMESVLSKAFNKESLAYKDGATRLLKLPGEPTLNDVIQNFSKYEKLLDPRQQAAIKTVLEPWKVIEELSKRYNLPVELWPKGFYAHRQVLKRTETVVDPLSLKEWERVEETRPLVVGGVGAKQAVSKPRIVKSEADGLAHGVVEYMPWIEAQEIGMRQRLTEIFDQRLLNTYGKIEPETLAGLEVAATKLKNLKRLERELIEFRKRPIRGGFVWPKGLVADPEMQSWVGYADTLSHMSKKADRLEMSETLLGTVRNAMKPIKAEAAEIKAGLVEARKLRAVGKAEISQLRGGTKSRYLRGIDSTINRINNEIRPAMANIDASMAGIQALFALARQPLSYLRAAHLSTTSPAGLEALYESLYKTGQLENFVSMGLKLYSRDDFGEFAVRGIGRVPVVGVPFAVSSRWFSRWGNSLRLLMAKSGTAETGLVKGVPGFRGGIQSLQEGRDLMRGINLSTGYVPGNISTLETAMMFAPRWFRSQLSLVTDAFTKGGRAGGEARKNLAALIATGSMFTYGMNKALDNETQLDPTDPNFMRIRALGQDISVFGPWDTLVKGLAVAFKDGPEQGARYMVRSKASPVMGRVYDMMAGETFRGDKLSGATTFDILTSAAKMSTQWAPISLQATFERGVPTTPAEVAGAGVQFFGTKATPLTRYEKVSIKRDRLSQEKYNKDWDALEPYQKQELLDADPDLNYESQQAAWAERANLRTYYTDQQEMLDEALELDEVNAKGWRESYDDLRNREYGAFEEWERTYPDEAKRLVSRTSPDANYRALAEYYDAFRNSRTSWGALDNEKLDIALSKLEESWTSSQAAFVERNTGIYGTPKVKEYKQDQKKLRPYWELRDQVWAKMQEAYPKIARYSSPLEYEHAMTRKMKLEGQDPLLVQMRISKLPILVYLDRIVSTLRERYRIAHPDVDALLLKWGYTTTLKSQRKYTSRYSEVVG